MTCVSRIGWRTSFGLECLSTSSYQLASYTTPLLFDTILYNIRDSNFRISVFLLVERRLRLHTHAHLHPFLYTLYDIVVSRIRPMKMYCSNMFLSLALLTTSALAASSEDWKSRSIYQIMTDRFAVDDGSTTEPCDAGLGTYCGGTFNGIRKRLDYIQGMHLCPTSHNANRNTV